MSCTAPYVSELRARGFRMTSQRKAVLHVLRHSVKHLSALEVFEQARRDAPGITIPTVYRTLEFLVDNELALPSQVRGGHWVYEIAGKRHLHLVCRVCASEMEVGHELLERVVRNMETSTGYALIDRHMTFFGLCPDCQARRIKKGGS